MLKKLNLLLPALLIFINLPAYFYASQTMIERRLLNKKAKEWLLMASLASCEATSLKNALVMGADPNTEDMITGDTALMFVAKSHIGQYKECIRILLAMGANRYFQFLPSERTFMGELLDLRGKKNFDDILQKKHPELLEDPEIIQALDEYEKRRRKYSKMVVSPQILQMTQDLGLLRDLTDIIANYLTEVAPIEKVGQVQKEEPVQQETKKQKTSWCAIS